MTTNATDISSDRPSSEPAQNDWLKQYSSFACLALILLTVCFWPRGQALVVWGLVALWTVGFIMSLGLAVAGRPLGVLVNEQNVMSLSRFQTAFWTVIIVSALVVILSLRIQSSVSDVLNVKFTSGVLELLGITAVALVGSPLIESTKKDKEPSDSALKQTATTLRQNGLAPKSVAEQIEVAGASSHEQQVTAGVAAADTKPGVEKAKTDSLKATIDENSQGLLYKNPTIGDARFSDMFRGSEVGNFAQMDLAKVQMFFFTLVVGVAYVYALTGIITGEAVTADSVSLPQLTDGMVGLLAISNGSYLGSKAVVHTST
jgi:hypothetical protein